jgi:hypothetical protein
VEDLGEVIRSRLGHELVGQSCRLLFTFPTPRCGRSKRRRDAAGDTMEPTGQAGPASDRSRLPRQDEECRLKGILGVMSITKYRAADAEHHRAVSLDQGLESQFAGLTVCSHEPLE